MTEDTKWNLIGAALGIGLTVVFATIITLMMAVQ